MTASASAIATTTDGPQAWADTILQRRHDRWADVDSGAGTWLGIGDVADEALLAELHRRVMQGFHAPADTAATYLAGWFDSEARQLFWRRLEHVRRGQERS